MSKTSCLILQGKKSFSISKLDQLTHAFNKINGIEAKISSSEIYLIASDSDLKNDLQDIITLVKGSEKIDQFSFLIGPRVGTITPWSSKTGDIFINVGIDNIQRVERFFGFQIEGVDKQINNLDLSMLFDRMTQDVYESIDECSSIINTNTKRSINHIDLLDNGKQALVKANIDFGFALSADEIDNLFNYYSNENRNHNDEELIMFAQANYEN